MSEDITKSEELPVGQLIWAIVLIWTAISVTPYVIQGLFSPLDGWKLADHALLGDTFGFTNSFFSSLALAFLVYTSYLQRRDLGVQRRALANQEIELELTRAEHKRSAAAQEEASKELKEQNRLQLLSLKLDALEKSMAGYKRHIENSLDPNEREMAKQVLSSQRKRYTELFQELNI